MMFGISSWIIDNIYAELLDLSEVTTYEMPCLQCAVSLGFHEEDLLRERILNHRGGGTLGV